MNIHKLIPRTAKPAVFTVEKVADRWCVVRTLPNTPPTVVEDLRTEEFAKKCAEAYNARGFQ